jgi:hypothetical protein
MLLDAGAPQNPARLEAEPIFDLGICDAALGHVVAKAGHPRSGSAHAASPAKTEGASAMAA